MLNSLNSFYLIGRRIIARSKVSNRHYSDLGLSALLAIQCLTLFVAVPFGAAHPFGHTLLDLCYLVFAAICVATLSRNQLIRVILLIGIALLAVEPIAGPRIIGRLGFAPQFLHNIIAMVAFVFNAIITAIVAIHVFASGTVTMHRIRGAILLYLNIAELFAIAYGLLLIYVPGSIMLSNSSATTVASGRQFAEMSYFSLSTITTTGFGDFLPVYPLARSLANLEAVFGQLFPATLVARLVALQLAHRSEKGSGECIDLPKATGSPITF